MEKASSLIEAEAILGEVDDGHRSPVRAEAASEPGEAGSTETDPHPSGFAPASASQSGFSPTAAARAEPGAAPARSATESGVFSGPTASVSGARLLDGLQSALGAASRHETGLGSLQRALRDASRAFTASRQAQEALTEELRIVYRGLNELMSEKAAVERYAALLTQERDAALDAAEEARREAKRERDFLIREQDRFIQLLLEEHEAELDQVRRSLGQARAATALAAGHAEELAAPRLSGAALARQALASTAMNDQHGASIVSGDKLEEQPTAAEEHAPAYPPPAAVLDLETLAAEVDGNSERPPPIRRIGVAEPKIHLKPARVPTQLYDTLVSPLGDVDQQRKG